MKKAKKVLSMLVSFLLIFSCISNDSTLTFANSSGDYDYSILDDGTVRIDKYNGTVVDLIVPDTIAGKKVTQIGENSFSYGKQKNIVLPDTITYIGEGAFCQCERLIKINIPIHCDEIGYEAFRGTSITSIVVPASVYKIGSYAFYDTPLEKIVIEDGVVILEEYVFGDCKNLKTVVLPKSVKEVGFGTFWYNCYSLESVTVLNPNCEFSEVVFECKIVSYNQSKVYEYAMNHKIEFECIEHVWDNNGYIDIEPTCNHNGRFVYPCKYCKAKKISHYIDKKNHKVIIDKSTIPTFQKDGKTEGKHCSICGTVIVAQKRIPKLGSPSLAKVVKGKKSFTATWKAVADIDGYEVLYSLKKNMKKPKKKVVSAKKTKITIKKLKSKKKYYVRIRAFKYVNGKKVYSKWSAKKSIKVK